MGQSMSGFDGKDCELLLGRSTSEIFGAYWPHQSADNSTTQTLNAAKEHAASRTPKTLRRMSKGARNWNWTRCASSGRA